MNESEPTLPQTYSVELNLRDHRVLVVGLGVVGARKAAGLVSAGAVVTGVDPGENVKAVEGIYHLREAFCPEHLDGARLAFAAATPEVNREVVCQAKARGIWVNAATDSDQGDFTLPATRRLGRITLAVSTSGVAPALAIMLRDRAVEAIAPAVPLVELFASLRPLALEQVTDRASRRALFARWAEPCWLDVLAFEGLDVVRSAWLDLLHQLTSEASSLHGSPELS